MRKVIILLLVSFFIGVNAFAGGSGNCIQPLRTTTEFIGVGGAFEYNYMHERMNDLDNKYGPKSMSVKRFHQIYGKVTVGLFDNFNIYGKIGGCNYDLKFIARPQDAEMEIDLKNGLYTGAGINALFPMPFVDMKNLFIGGDIQGNFFINDVKGITRSGETATSTGGSFYGLDGENSLYVAYKFDIDKIKTSIVPYIGGYYSWMMVGTLDALSYDTPKAGYVDKKHFQAAYDLLGFGLLLGVDIDIAKYISLNVEGRFFGETAFTTGATIKF
jgi:hypothetical protein